MNLDVSQLEHCLTRVLGSIRARFVELGYFDDDIDELRRHHEVNNSKPMSDRGAPDSTPKLSRLTLNVSSVATYRTASHSRDQ